MGLFEFAKNELEMIEKDVHGIQETVNNYILHIVKIFSEQGNHKTANYTINILERLLRHLPLSPLTGDNNEWLKHPEGKLQNKRCSTVYKDSEEGEAYKIDGKIFSSDGGKTWYTNRESRISIGFPYTVPLFPDRVILSEKELKEKQTEQLLEDKQDVFGTLEFFSKLPSVESGDSEQ